MGGVSHFQANKCTLLIGFFIFYNKTPELQRIIFSIQDKCSSIHWSICTFTVCFCKSCESILLLVSLPSERQKEKKKWDIEPLVGCIWLHQSNKRAHCCSVCGTLKRSMVMNVSLDIETSSRYFHTTWEKPSALKHNLFMLASRWFVLISLS